MKLELQENSKYCETIDEVLKSKDFKRIFLKTIENIGEEEKYKSLLNNIISEEERSDYNKEELKQLNKLLDKDLFKSLGQEYIKKLKGFTVEEGKDFLEDYSVELIIEELKNRIEKIILEEEKNKDIETKEEIDFSNFGKPDEEEKEKIKSWCPEYRKKVEGKIEFGVTTGKGSATILTLPNNKKLTFDKSPILDSDTKERNWYEADSFAKENNRKVPSNDDFEQLFEGFHGVGFNEELKGILNIALNYYWSSTVGSSYPSYAWIGYFSYGSVTHSSKTYTIRVLCIHD